MTLPNFRQYYQATIIKTSHWHKTRHKDEWNNRDPGTKNSSSNGQLSYDKRDKNIQGRKCNLFNKCWKSWKATWKSMKLVHSFIPYTKINWLKDLIIRHDTIKLLEESMRKTYTNINHSNIFLDQSSQGKRTKSKNKQMSPNQT